MVVVDTKEEEIGKGILVGEIMEVVVAEEMEFELEQVRILLQSLENEHTWKCTRNLKHGNLKAVRVGSDA
ncbi:hypothetical protein C5167_045396 [Papaver somniferum]|uniref:Uncharacterized protein n=1 Tax=Papaver somniferum TaxID=3469 RepID=A0A4Y7LAV3_PAPSO|nr:hypothetical protein C5167_045396 [Papaver somniferum]